MSETLAWQLLQMPSLLLDCWIIGMLDWEEMKMVIVNVPSYVMISLTFTTY